MKEKTDLWQPWSSSNPIDADLENDVQDGQVLLKCLGYQHCQRPFRTLTCRAFPFFPYLDSRGNFLGLVYFQEYRESVLDNQQSLRRYPLTIRLNSSRRLSSFLSNTRNLKRVILSIRLISGIENALSGDKIILLDFDRKRILLDPDSEISHQVGYEDLESFGPFSITKDLIFPDENPE